MAFNYVGKLLSNFKGFYNDINSATLTGAIDTVVVRQQDGTFLCAPFHVRFGKMGVLRSREKVVDIEINGEAVDLHMKLGEKGEAFFVQEITDDDEDIEPMPAYLATSPIPSADDLIRMGLEELQMQQGNVLGDSSQDAYPSDISFRRDSMRSSMSSNGTRERHDSEMSDFRPIEPAAVKECEVSIKVETEPIIEETSETTTVDVEKTTTVDVEKTTTVDVEKTTTVDVEKNTTAEKTVKKKTPKVKLENELAPMSHVKKVRGKRRKKKMEGERKEALDLKEMRKIKGTKETMEDFLEQEGVFEMDFSDEEKEKERIQMMSMARTVSLPVIEENKFNMTDSWADSQYAAQLHPFSDGDITPIVSPVGSRPETPKSDTEYELGREKEEGGATVDENLKWEWGELPQQTQHSKAGGADNQQTSEQTGGATGVEGEQGGLFTFMRQTKKMRHQPDKEGIYLDDLNLDEMDPEIAALYLYTPKGAPHHIPTHHLRSLQDEDNESGRGASIPQSPVSLEGCDPRHHIDLENKRHYYELNQPDIAMSLCGGLKESEDISKERFMQFLVTYDDFCENPNLVSDPNLVIRIGDKHYNWQIASPIIMSMVAYQRPLPDPLVNQLVKEHMPKKETKRRGWFSWGRYEEPPVATTTASTVVAAAGGEAITVISSESKKDEPSSLPAITGTDVLALPSPPQSSPSSSAPNTPEKHKTKIKKSDDDNVSTSSNESGTSEHSSFINKNMNGNKDQTGTQREKYRKIVRLSSEQIEKLNLRDGVNEISFSVTTQYQGTTRCTSHIYLWDWDDKIIISDIDGTITKSDVLGQVLPMIGKDWSQSGVAQLFTGIRQNGYKFVYLSARAIGQAKITRDYLKSIKQGELSLPDGPLLLAPSSLLTAFHKEVIERKPEEFKISCLRDLKSLFPENRNPFYAGYGNKINDVWAYRAVGIPISRIFTINHRGELRHELTQTFQTSYTKLSDVVDHIFPSLPQAKKPLMSSFHAPDEFSSFTYWRPPLPDIEAEIQMFREDTKKDDKTEKK